MSTHSDVEKFPQVVFGSDFGTRAIFTNLNPAADTRNLAELDAGRDCYMGPWAYPDDGKLERGARATEARCLVIDDVGTAVDLFTGEAISRVSFEQVALLGPYTAITRTSPSNHQYWFKLDPPVPASEWPGFRAGVIKILGVTPHNLGVGQIFRLPMGRNTKRGYDVELIELKEGVALKSATIPREAVVKPKTPGEVRQVHDIKRLVEWASNDDLSYDEWIAKGQRIYALDTGEDGREAWHELSARSSKNNAETTETKWHTFTADVTRGGLLLAEAQAAGGEAFTRWEAKEVFNDGAVEAEPLPKPKPRKGITATPFKWMDLAKTNPRDWLYGDILLRKFISMTVAPGGTGKSSLVAVETLAQVAGKALLGEDPSGELRVWLWNLEDPYEETQKKILAAAKHYGIAEADIGDRLFVDSGRDQQLVVAEMRGTVPVIMHPVVAALVEQIRLRKIDVVVIDPFVSCHWVPENDNGAMDMVVKEWGRVAEEGNCAVHLVDHTSKAGSKEVVTDSSRGAKSKTDAARIVRVVNRMSETDGKAYGIMDTWRYFNTFNDKANMAPPKSKRDWFRMEGIWAGNGANAAQAFSVGAAAVPSQGDSIGVAVKWTPPNAQTMATGDAFTKVAKVMGTERWNAAPQSKNWVGNAVAQGLQMSALVISDREAIKTIIKKWISDGLLKELTQMDKHRNPIKYIELAQVY